MVTASPAPTGGGQLPANIGAPLSDAWGTPLGYCSWDNGTINSSAGRINGDNPGTQSSVVFAIISAGPNKTFETTCAQARVGNVQGDDGIRYVTVAQINQGVGGTIYYGDPVADMTALNNLNTATIPAGQTRLVESSNTYYTWNGSSWVQASGASYWTANGNNIHNTNTGNVGIGTPTPGAKLDVAGNINASGDICENGKCLSQIGGSVTSYNSANCYQFSVVGNGWGTAWCANGYYMAALQISMSDSWSGYCCQVQSR